MLLLDELFMDGEGNCMGAEADRGECGEVGAARDTLPVEAGWG
jgi:hypothetical protein